MAYAAVASLSQTIDIILIYHDNYTSPQFKDEILSLQKHMIFFESFLEDYPERGNNWDETIREVTDRAEEIVELLLSDSFLESKSTVGSSKPKLEKGKIKGEVHYDFHELGRVIEEMESIADRVKGRRHTEVISDSNDELMEIISRLRGGSSALETVGILGMGGMGKAALARNVYNHPLIVEHFEIRAWSKWGNLLDLARAVKAGESVSNSEEQQLVQSLHAKRYLVVIIGMMRVHAFWRVMYKLAHVGLGNRNGNRVLFTTRSSELAMYADHTYKMRFLDEDKPWNLLQEKIFKGDPCPAQLEYVGKTIARNCKGHPLSINLVSGILAAADRTEAVWKYVSEDMNNIIDSGVHGDELAGVLALSYTYLPHHLRPCFLHFASFPEDQEIRVSKLIKLWVAEGFLNETEYKSFDERGEEHVEDFVHRGFVSVSRRKSNGGIKSITVPKVVRDLCLTQARMDDFIHHVCQNPDVMKLGSCRRVSSTVYGNYFLQRVCGSNIRTLIINCYNSELDIVRWRIRNVRLLRILDLSNAYHFDLPDEVFELFHLRYLAFHSGFSISRAISNLQNLQTLIIFPRKRMSHKFGKLPDGIWRMPQLRHLFLSRFKLPSHQIRATSALRNLQSLSIVNFVCSRENLKMIPNLKKLSLLCTKSSKDVVQDYELCNLICLRKLENLKIEIDWSSSSEKEHKTMSFAFPSTLKKLSLIGLGFVWEDMNNVGLLPNLQVLKLRNHACIGEKWETSEGGFSQLISLLVEESNLENWITEARHFPKLKCLMLHHCSSLLKVASDMGNIPTFEIIESEAVSDELSDCESDSEGSSKFWR